MQINYYKLLESKINEIKYYQINLRKEPKFKRVLFNSYSITHTNLLLSLSNCFEFYSCINKKEVADTILNRFIYFLEKPINNVPYRYQKLITLLFDYYLNNIIAKKIIGFFSQPSYLSKDELYKNYICTLNTVVYDVYYLMLLVKETNVNCSTIKRLDYSNKTYFYTFTNEKVPIIILPEILNITEYIKKQINVINTILVNTNKVELHFLIGDNVDVDLKSFNTNNFKKVEIRRL
jgi:hypothetical protein